MDFRITIPKPCHEDWNTMTPEKQGRFCRSCSKTVVDFTEMLPGDIRHYFQENREKKICGHFRTAQLSPVGIDIPVSVLIRAGDFQSRFRLALLICMGTLLFSCSDSKGHKRTLGVIRITTDTTAMEPPPHVKGKIAVPPPRIPNGGTVCEPKALTGEVELPEALTGAVIVLPDSTATSSE